jgi:hypothetical protein
MRIVYSGREAGLRKRTSCSCLTCGLGLRSACRATAAAAAGCSNVRHARVAGLPRRCASCATRGACRTSRANTGRSVRRAGVRAGAGPSVPDGSVAAVGSGPAVPGARAELHRARRDDEARAVPRAADVRVGQLRRRRARDRRGVRARRQRVGGACARTAAGGVPCSRAGSRSSGRRRIC